MDIKSKVAVITGGSSGLGAGAARALAAGGAKICIFDLNPALGETVAKELGGVFCRVDVSDEASVTEGFAKAAALGEVRMLVTCAGIVQGEKTASKGVAHKFSIFSRVIGVNLIGTFLCASQAAARMQTLEPNEDGERGVIVMTASIAAYEGQIGQIAYSASKGGVAGMTLPMARDLSRDGIRAVSIAPGMFHTAMVEGLPGNLQESLVSQTMFPKRLGKPAEFGALALHICENPMINGEVIRLDGAMRMQPR